MDGLFGGVVRLLEAAAFGHDVAAALGQSQSMADDGHGRILTLCLREAGDWTAFVRYRGGDEYGFVGGRADGVTTAAFVLRSREGAADFLMQLMDDSPVAHELLLMPASTAQQSFEDVREVAQQGEGVASLVHYAEARPFSRERALLLLGLLRECLAK